MLQLVHEIRGSGKNGVEHWVVLHRKNGALFLYDSALPSHLSDNLKQTIKQLAGNDTEKLVITAPVVQRQHDGFSCGYYAVANMTSIILDPSSDLSLQFYDKNELIPHVKSILIDSNPVSAFLPRRKGRRPTAKNPRTFTIDV